MRKRTAALLLGIAAGAGYVLGDRNRREKAKDLLDRYGRVDRWTDLRQRASASPQWTGRWTPASRLVAGAIGGALSYYGMRRRGLLGAAMTATGMGMITRGASNRATRSGFGFVPVISRVRRRMAA